MSDMTHLALPEMNPASPAPIPPNSGLCIWWTREQAQEPIKQARNPVSKESGDLAPGLPLGDLGLPLTSLGLLGPMKQDLTFCSPWTPVYAQYGQCEFFLFFPVTRPLAMLFQ